MHNALRMNYVINCRLLRDLVGTGVHGETVREMDSTISLMFLVKVIRIMLVWLCVLQ